MSFFRNWFYLYLKQTPSEVTFERMIAQLGEPYRVQYPFPALHRIADFALHLRKIVIEIDGASHQIPTQARKDLVTTIALEKRGWRVIRFTNSEVIGIQSSVHLNEAIEAKLTTRPDLAALEAALLQYPEPVGKQSKRRARRKAPGPKSARKRQPLA